jgi:gluconolactonase
MTLYAKETVVSMIAIEHTSEWEKVAEGLNFPEGPAWDGKDTLYFSNCKGGYISKIGPEDCSILVSAGSQPDIFERSNGLTVGRDGLIYACEYGKKKGAIHRITPEGRIERFIAGYKGKPFRRPNDLIFDPVGNLYFTDPSAYNPKNPDGIIYRIDAKTKKVTIAYDGVCFCNGLAFSADGMFLYVAESAKHRVLKFPVKEDGSLGKPDVFINMPGGDPDGMNFDNKGNLYVAHFGGGAVWVIAPDGSIVKKLKTPGKKPSNVEFAGKDLRTLYITEDETNAVYRTPVETPGLPLFFHPSRGKEKGKGAS